MEQFSLKAEGREKIGVRGTLSSLRNSGTIPATIYGAEKGPNSLSINEKEFLAIMKKDHNSIIKLKYPQGEDSVIVKTVQRHVVSGKVIHVDFYRISMKKKIEVKVTLKFVGEPYGVKTQGGVIEHDMREVTVKCLPADIPHEIEINIADMKIGDTLRVKDIKLGNWEIKEDVERVIASVMTAKEEVVEKVAGEAEAAKEPEVIAKGKKDEEGAAEGAAVVKEEKK